MGKVKEMFIEEEQKRLEFAEKEREFEEDEDCPHEWEGGRCELCGVPHEPFDADDDSGDESTAENILS